MVAAVERQKFVYVLNKDQQKLTISSPKQAHKSNILTFDVVALDVHFDNPLFACIQADCGDIDNQEDAVHTGQISKMLTFYEFDIGQNCVTRKQQMPIQQGSHKLISVPLKPIGPGGCIVCGHSTLFYKKIGHPQISCSFPKRQQMPLQRGVFVIAAAVHKQKKFFIIILQTQMGDLFKVSLQYVQQEVTGMQILYFGTIPPTNAFCITKGGYMYAASEFGNHSLYIINQLGENDPNPIKAVSTTGINKQIQLFNPKIKKNILKRTEYSNLASINDFKVIKSEEQGLKNLPKIFAVCGRGHLSTLRVMKQGLSIKQLGKFTKLPQNVTNAWTLYGGVDDVKHKYIVISLETRTCVLKISDTVKEQTNSGFVDKKLTLHVGMMADGSYLQAYHDGVLHLKPNGEKQYWKSPKRIVCVTSNQSQAAVAMQGGQLIYFEVNEFFELQEKKRQDCGSEIICLNLPNVPNQRPRAGQLAVGFDNNLVRVFSLMPGQELSAIGYQSVPSIPTSVLLVEMESHGGQMSASMENPHDIIAGAQYMQSQSTLYLYIGLQNGVLLRTVIDRVTGGISTPRARLIGTQAIKLAKTVVGSSMGVIVLSNRPWICYNHLQQYHVSPLSEAPAIAAAEFSNDNCKNGMVLFWGKSLRIINLTQLGNQFTQQSIPLSYTPRKILHHTKLNKVIILQTDHNILDQYQRTAMRQKASEKDQQYKQVPQSITGYSRIEAGRWASKIRVVNAATLQTEYEKQFTENQAAFSMELITFGKFQETFLVLGKTKNMRLAPRSMSQASIQLFRLVQSQGKSELLHIHSTPVNDVPLSFAQHEGRLLAGIGNSLRVFQFGKKQLLLKCQNFNFQTAINNIRTFRNRIICTDMSDSFHVLKYRPDECLLYIFVDDIIPRWVTTFQIIDIDTIVGADKFGNLFVCRIPAGSDDLAQDDPTATKFKWENGYLNGAEFKLQLMNHFHAGQLVTSIQKVQLSEAGRDILLYSTSTGSIAALVPFQKKSQVDFFIHLEMYMRQELEPICGRDHSMYRSYYSPVKDVVDGDLCQAFSSLDGGKQRQIMEGMEKNQNEITQKLQEIRNKIL